MTGISTVHDPRTIERDATTPRSTDDDSIVRLDIAQIGCYEHNPRLLKNAKWHQIQDSISASKGLTEPLSVTRRPGDDRFVVHQGGNTRLAIVKELFAKTEDEAYRTVPVTIQPFTSELEIAALHHRENTCRGNLTFFEQAWSAYRQFEIYCRENVGPATGQDFVAFVNAEYGAGLTGHLFSRMKFAVEVLYQHIPTCLVQGAMSQRAIRHLIAVQSTLRKAWKASKFERECAFDEVFFTLLSRQDKDLAASYVSDADPASYPDDRIAIDWQAFFEDLSHELTIVADIDYHNAEAWIAEAFRSGDAQITPDRAMPPSSAASERRATGGEPKTPSQSPSLLELRARALRSARAMVVGTALEDCIHPTPDDGVGFSLGPIPRGCAQDPATVTCWSILATCSGDQAPRPAPTSVAALSPHQLRTWVQLVQLTARVAASTWTDRKPNLPTREEV